MSFPIGLQPQERRQEWIPLNMLASRVTPPPAGLVAAAPSSRPLPPPPPPRPWTLPPATDFTPPPPPRLSVPPASASQIPSAAAGPSTERMGEAGRRNRRSSTEPAPAGLSATATLKRRRRTALELWGDDKGRTGEIWCHGCGERVGGLRFACDECLSFELCSSCVPKLDSSLQHPRTHHFHLHVHPLLAPRFSLPTVTSPARPISPPPIPITDEDATSTSRPIHASPPRFNLTKPEGKRRSVTFDLPLPPTTLPALHLLPISPGAFEAKALSLPVDGSRIILGRCSKSDEATSSNGHFDGKVLSRSHAEVWFDPELSKVFIRDLGSVNGTYVQSERLTPSGAGRKSEARELRDGDVLEFGSAAELKVSCHVRVLLDEEDALRTSDTYLPSSSSPPLPTPRAKRASNNPFLNSAASSSTTTPTFCDLRTHSPVQGCPPLRIVIPNAASSDANDEVWQEDWWSDKESDPGSDATDQTPVPVRAATG